MHNRLVTWTRRRRLVAGGVVVGLAVIAVVVMAFVAGSSGPSRPARQPIGVPAVRATSRGLSAPSPSSSPGPALARAASLPPLLRTDDPVAYARAVATALFATDPATTGRAQVLQFWQGELPTVVYADAASRGLSLAAQNGDAIDNLTSNWIPTQAVWDSEAADHTTDQFRITSVSVPDYWVNAVAAGTFRDPGLQMERVMGVLTQTYGTDPAHRFSTTRSIVIDIGLLCGPTQPDGCRLLAPQPPPSPGQS